MDIKILNLHTLIASDNQDIYQRLDALESSHAAGISNYILPLLYDLQDILVLYQHIKQLAIYDPLYFYHNNQIIKYRQSYLQSIKVIKRCIRFSRCGDQVRYGVQLHSLMVLLAFYLEDEYHYLQDNLSQHLSDLQLNSMAHYYEQLKLDGC